jgi:hypothetical protein
MAEVTRTAKVLEGRLREGGGEVELTSSGLAGALPISLRPAPPRLPLRL